MKLARRAAASGSSGFGGREADVRLGRRHQRPLFMTYAIAVLGTTMLYGSTLALTGTGGLV